MSPHRIGIDLGGTKIEAALLAPNGEITWRQRIETPPTYPTIIAAITHLVQIAEAENATPATVGIGIPGTLSPATGLVKNANTQCLIGQALDHDLAQSLSRPIRIENDANCFALSEATDGAGATHRTVFGVILGTGCGGGIVVDGHVLQGRNRIAGEWGHTPLPWPGPDEYPQPPCWCGQHGCLELYLAGPGLAATANIATAAELPARAAAGDPTARQALARHTDRLARGLAVIVNILDPDIIVLGGGLSNMTHLYTDLPARLAHHVFSDTTATPIVQNRHGDSSGVRGAAWLWPTTPHA